MKKQGMDRRSFMKQVAAASVAGPLILPNLSFASSANGRLQHAAIGVGGQGTSDLGNISSHKLVDVVALCDIDSERLTVASQRFPKARLYSDWRVMLDAEEGHIDSVNVSTPDHTHAPASMSAIKNGLHVYCEKPLTHEVYETRKVTEAAREQGVATQMGNQIHSHEFYRTAVHWVKEGAIGKVKAWHSWCGATYSNETKLRPAGEDPIPANVDWDLWIGVGQMRPYKHDTYHPFKWRNSREFGGGATGDFGCHIFDPVFSAIDVNTPLSIKSIAESNSDDIHPAWVENEYLFKGTDWTVDDTIVGTWRDGGKKPETSVSPHLPKGFQLPASGSLLIGEEGTLLIPHVDKPSLYPLNKFEKYPKPKLAPLSHYHDFVEAALGNVVAGSNFDFAGPLTEAVLLGNVANRFPGETLQWDAKNLKFTNFDAANALLQRNYRKGFKVRGL